MSSRSRRTARAVGSRRTSRSAVVVAESVAGRRKAASGECMYVPEPSIPMGRSAAAAETVEETVEETAAAAAAAAVGDMARGHRCMYQVDPRANLFSWSKKCTCRSRHDGSPGFVSATCGEVEEASW